MYPQTAISKAKPTMIQSTEVTTAERYRRDYHRLWPRVFHLTTDRRRRLTHRTLPVLGGLAVLALVGGVVVGSAVDSRARSTARAVGRAWQRGDYHRMRELLTPESRRRWSERKLDRAYSGAAATATAVAIRIGDPRGERGGAVRLPVEFRTRVFGTVRGEVLVPVDDRAVAWAPHLVFPGLEQGASLRRRTDAPARGRILSRDGKTLAKGPARSRSSPLGPLAGSISGRVEAGNASQRQV